MDMFCLKWHDFNRTVGVFVGDMKKQSDFSDVTLISEDGNKIFAHKIILSSFSPLFQDILNNNSHPHPFIYMRGIKTKYLRTIITTLKRFESIFWINPDFSPKTRPFPDLKRQKSPDPDRSPEIRTVLGTLQFFKHLNFGTKH